MIRRRPMLLVAILATLFVVGGWAVGSIVARTASPARAAKPDARIAYGGDALQHVDLWRPAGAGPFPVVLMIHGGCWSTDIATANIMDRAAADLRDHGFAVWNIEYRGVDRAGGGYPGTFLDVAAAADLLEKVGARYELRPDRVAVLGHSAGGHLALWLAAQGGVAPSSPLHAKAPRRFVAAVSLGGLSDLQAASVPPGDTCGAEPVALLVGASGRSDPFADTSPARLGRPALPIALINGVDDRIAPPSSATAYAGRVGAIGIRTFAVAGEAHMDEIVPSSRSWTIARTFLSEALRRP